MTDETTQTNSSDSPAPTVNDARLKLLYEIGRILASANTINEAAPQILQAIGRGIEFQLGEMWWMADEKQVMRLEKVWHLPSDRLKIFVAASRSREFSSGEDLPGKVWAENAPVWLEDLEAEDSLPRRSIMKEAGLQSAFAFPVLLGEKLLGVFSFFSRDPHLRDEALLQMFVAVGMHIGQFIKRENIESELRDSEESYRIVAETASDAIIKINAESRILFVNHAVERVFGYRAEAMIGQSLTMIMPEELRERHLFGFRRYLETGERKLNWEGLKIPARHADGHIFPLEISFGEYNEKGKRFFIGIARDITDREQTEKARAYLAAIIESSEDAIISKDLNGIITSWNKGAERIFGYNTDEVIGKSVTILIPPHRIGEEPQILERIRRGEKIDHYETTRRRKTGTELDISLTVSPIQDQTGKIIGVSKIARDITERRQAEQLLLEREQLALLTADVNRTLIQNDSLEEILHICTESLVERLDVAFARIWTLDAAENMLELQASSGCYTHLNGGHSRIPVGKFKIGRIAEERKPHLTNNVIGDALVADQDWAEREKMVAFAGYPLIIEDQLVGVIAMFSRTAFTERIMQALASVANAIALGIKRKQTEAERERLLESEQQAREIAEQSNRAKDEFIALVSHELRSPLNAMLGWTRILQNQKPDEQTTNYALDVIVRNARSQSKLIEDLLDIARIDKGKLRLEMRPVELVPIINSVMESVKTAADGKNINITRSFDMTGNFIFGDEERLTQIVENLLSNAVKFTSAGGTIDVRLRSENGRAEIVISDTGQGIREDFLPQLFERFKQADPATTRRHGGLGIGLSLARDLVELHGGAISARSAGEDKGATFTVSLPLRMVLPIKEDAGRRENMGTQGKLDGFWILAVDDEADAREIVSFMLQINGAKVTTANSAIEALDILQKSGERLPDVLLSDISMPNESGYALLEKIRSLPRENGGQIPAVALTAFNRPEDRQNAFEAGFQKHLGKPVEMEDLISAIIETAGAK